MPDSKNRQANRKARNAGKEAGLTNEQQRQLHEELGKISNKDDLPYREIVEIARDIKAK
jgi:hypothetical protein